VAWATYECISNEAARIARENKREVITSVEIQQAVRQLFPGELARHGCSEGRKAVAKYQASLQYDNDQDVKDVQAF